MWFGLVYIMVAAPGVGALYQWRGALQQGYMTLGEALVLFTIWLFQGLMISLIMLDIVFQLGVMVAAVVQTLLPNTGIPFPGGVKTTLMEDLCLKWNTPEKKTGSYGLGAMLLQASEQIVEKCVAPEENVQGHPGGEASIGVGSRPKDDGNSPKPAKKGGRGRKRK